MAIETIWFKCLNALYLHNGSDLHFHPRADHAEVWLRIDGRCQYHVTLERERYQRLLNYLKALAGLSITHQCQPQEGAMIDPRGALRLSFCPVYWGECLTVRVHHKRKTYDLIELGWSENETKKWLHFLETQSGLHLILGPTGAGKTTTLYAALMALSNKGLNIMMIEDPIEQPLSGINQIEKKTLPLDQWIKVMLRQDPDVMVIGELRDAPMLQVATQLALTGHTVLSTLHAGNVEEAVARLGCSRIPFFLKSLCEVRLPIGSPRKMKHRFECFTETTRSRSLRLRARTVLNQW